MPTRRLSWRWIAKTKRCNGFYAQLPPMSRASPTPKTGSTNWAHEKNRDAGTTMKRLAQQYDCLLVDLDGTVFRGSQPTEGAVQSLSEVDSRTLFVTNNATRTADQVASHLRELGFTATADDVVTSAQSAAHLLADQLPQGARVLIVGTQALADEISAVGLQPVRSFDDDPAGVVEGLSMTVASHDLAEAALAIRAGALWVASNVDATLPNER